MRVREIQNNTESSNKQEKKLWSEKTFFYNKKK